MWVVPLAEPELTISLIASCFRRTCLAGLELTRECLGNLTPADAYFGRGQTILLKREGIKRKTFEQRRLQHQKQAAQIKPSDDPDLPLSKYRDVSKTMMTDILHEFRTALEQETFVKDPRTVHQNNARVWNQMRGNVIGWPDTKLSVPTFGDYYTRNINEFPQSLHDDLTRYVRRFVTRGSQTQDLNQILDVEQELIEVSEKTIRKHEYDLRRSASILVQLGHDIRTIDSLAYIVRPQNVRAILKFLLERRARRATSEHTATGRKSRTGYELARLLAIVAEKHVKAPQSDVDEIRKLAERILPKSAGPTRKNRRRLTPLRGERNLVKLFSLPKVIRKTVEAKPHPSRADALLMQHAVALSILIHAPIRIGNLAAMRLDKHLIWSQGQLKGQLIIDFEAGEVKNGQDISFPLPTGCADIIRIYISRYRLYLTGEECPYLFPGPNFDRPKRSDTLGKQLTKLLHEKIGLEINPHLFRHLVHIIVLNRYSGAYATISRILGNSSLQTAISDYACEDMNIAMRAFQDLIGDVRNGGSVYRASDADTAYGFNARGY